MEVNEKILLTPEQLDQMVEKIVSNTVVKAADEFAKKTIEEVAGAGFAAKVEETVTRLRINEHVFGRRMFGSSEGSRKEFVKEMTQVIANMHVKDGTALLENPDNVGGYLVAPEVAADILRISASVGLVASQATRWPTPKGNELRIPAYLGAFLSGSYLGTNVAGPIQGMPFNQTRLLIEKWQIAFAIDNALLKDASVALAEWLMTFVAEALANMLDYQAFVGKGNPFTGILNHPNVEAYSLGGSATSGQTTFASFKLVEDTSRVMGSVEESILEGACFVFHRTVWAEIRAQKDGAGNYILPWAGAANVIEVKPMAAAPQPVGNLMSAPVYTNRWLPTLAQTAVSKDFGVFGNLRRSLGMSDKGDIEFEQYRSGVFGGKEIALADQSGMVFKQRHGVVVQLPPAVKKIRTAAS